MRTVVAAAVVVLGVAALGAPATALADRDEYAAIEAALAAHGIASCDADLVSKLDELDAPLYKRQERSRRVRLVVVGRECPAPDPETGYAPDDQVDGSLRVAIFKSKKLRARGLKHYLPIGLLGYNRAPQSLIVLDQLATPELEAAFEAAMTDLQAKEVFDNR